MRPEELLLELCTELGFDLAGIAPLAPPPAAERFDRWLAAGHHGSMEYLERQRDRIVDPQRIQPSGKSLLIVGLAHSRPAFELADGARVARYAAGRDYHNVLGKALRKLARRIEAAGIGGAKRSIVDAGPLLERSHAARAGIGFESKAANLLHPRFGPWFFLGELFLDIELEPTDTVPSGSCGTCTACIDACPTSAILEPGVVDARRCISYQTIESRGPIPHDLREPQAGWAFGCDVCSEVCPWGDRAPDVSARFGVHPALDGPGLVSWVRREAPFEVSMQGSPLKRPRREGLARNAAIVLGNRPTEEGRIALLHALDSDPSAIVREAALWGLARGHRADAGTGDRLARALEREVDPGARVGMRQTLDRL